MQLNPTGPKIAVVLGAAVWAGGRPSPTLARRVAHATALFKAHRVDMILGCGGVGAHPPSEASVIAQLCQQAGVPKAALLSENQSTSTRLNLSLAVPILSRLHPSEIVVVTDPYHAPRAALIAWQIGLPVSTSTPRAGSIGPRQWLKHTLREAVALLATALKLR